MKEIKNFPLKLKLAKLNILKNIDLPKIPILINNDIANFNSKRILSKNNLNNSRKLKTKLKIKQIKIKEDSKESQNLLLNKLRKIRANNLIKNQKSLAQMAKEIAEKNMTHYLSGYYDIFDGKNPFESESQSENYNDMNDINENSFNEKDSERSSTVRNIFKPKKLKKNYSQDFITVRNRVLKDDEKIQQYERLLLKNKLNKVTINVKDKNYEDLLSSYKALSQNKRIYDNIMNNYKGIMITQYSNSIGKLNPIIKIHENI